MGDPQQEVILHWKLCLIPRPMPFCYRTNTKGWLSSCHLNFTLSFWNILLFFNYVMLMWERSQALPSFPYCKQWKVGWGPGNEATET